MIFLNPLDYGVTENCRLVIKSDITDSIVILANINQGNEYIIEDKEIINNIYDYKFLFQKKIDRGFRNLTSYNYFFDSKIIEQYLLNKIQVNDEEAYDILSVYWKKDNKINIIKPLIRKTLEHIWKYQNRNIDNLKQMIRLSKNHKNELSILWENIISFISNLITLYTQLASQQLLKQKDFLDFANSSSNTFKEFLDNEIERLSDSNLQLDKFMMANYFSYLGNRKEAYKYFYETKNNFQNFDVLSILNVESNGVSTYKNPSFEQLKYDRNKVFPNFHFYSEDIPSKVDVTVVFSMDRKFLKAYGIQLLFATSILKNIHFHYHIVDDDGCALVEETNAMYDKIIKFRQVKDIAKPTFSYESLPEDIINETTYYACARFIHADYFLEKFNNDILILDADFYIIDELDNLLNKCRQHNIAASISSMGLSIFPWRRFMAGMIYLSNSTYSKKYSQIVTGYILDQIKNEKTWTLDQNALTYGFEVLTNKYPDMKFGNLRIKNPPIMHPKFRGLVEKE